MGIQVTWDDKAKGILRYDFGENWTWDDFFAAVSTAKALIDEVPGLVGIIMNTEAERMQYPPNMLTNMRKALSGKHPRTRIIVVVAKNQFLLVMLNILSQITGVSGKAMRAANDLPEARKLVSEYLDAVRGRETP